MFGLEIDRRHVARGTCFEFGRMGMVQCIDPQCPGWEMPCDCVWECRCKPSPHAHPLTDEARAIFNAEERKIDLRRRYGPADVRPGFYYVTCSARNLPGDAVRLRGPFTWHHEAIAAVDAARDEAEERDSRAVWMLFGTARYASDCGPGLLDAEAL